MKDRIKALRDALGLSQESFGEKIGLTRSGVSNIENGLRGVSERHVKLLSSAFNVNEVWLRTGAGDMFVEADNTIVAQLASEYKLTELDTSIVETYISLPEEYRAGVRKFILSLFERVAADPEAQLRAELDEIITDHEKAQSDKKQA